MTALMIAADSGDTQQIIALGTSSPDVNASDEDGWTAVMYAADSGHVDCIHALADLQARYPALLPCSVGSDSRASIGLAGGP